VLLLLTALLLQANPRQPVPDPAAQKETERLLRDIFKEDYAKKGQADRQALARKLLAQALQSKEDPGSRYVLLRESRSMAADVGDAETALSAVDELVKGYAVEGFALRHTTLATLALMAKTAPDWKGLAAAHLKLAEEAAAAEEFETAEKSGNAAVQLATRAKELPLVTRAQAVVKETGESKAQHDKVRKATEDLAANPEDPAANLALGHFKCFVRGKWDEGLPLLAKGKDEALKALAAADLAAPADSAGQIAAGDGWWTWSEKESGSIRRNARRRATHWYVKVLPGAGGLTKVRLEKRMAEVGVTLDVDLLALVDLTRDRVHGDWTYDGKTLTGIHTNFPARVQIPYEPPAEYDLTLVVERIEGYAPIHIGLVRESVQFYAAIDDFGGAGAGLGRIDGNLSSKNETWIPGRLLTNNKPATILCSVRKDEIAVSLDGKKLLSFKGGNERLSSHPDFPMPNRKALYVGSGIASYAISKISLLPVSGQGKVRTESSGFDPVGTWTGQGEGNDFIFKPGGVVESVKLAGTKFKSGTWERGKDSVVLTYPGSRVELKIVDDNTLVGGNWKLKRNK